MGPRKNTGNSNGEPMLHSFADYLNRYFPNKESDEELRRRLEKGGIEAILPFSKQQLTSRLEKHINGL